MIIPANQPAPISADLASSGLVVGMVAYDLTTGSPVQVTGVSGQINNVFPMTNIATTDSYFALFQGVANHTYIFVISAYTNDTYVTPTGVTQSRVAICRVLAPVIVSGLSVQVGCEEQPLQHPVVTAQNSDSNILISFFDDDMNPIDITSATALIFSVLEADGETLLTKTLGVAISLVAGEVNQALLSMKAADFALLPTGESDATVQVSLGGINYVVNCYAAINVQPGLGA